LKNVGVIVEYRASEILNRCPILNMAIPYIYKEF